MTPNERHTGMKAAMKAKLKKHKGKAPPKKPTDGPAEEVGEANPSAAATPQEEAGEAQLIASMRH